jgi:hypothetical protein
MEPTDDAHPIYAGDNCHEKLASDAAINVHDLVNNCAGFG